jgi:hypothetical protein
VIDAEATGIPDGLVISSRTGRLISSGMAEICNLPEE